MVLFWVMIKHILDIRNATSNTCSSIKIKIMLKNHLKTAWRSLLNNRVYTLINVGGLALGMAVALIIGLWVFDELSHDNYFVQKNKIAQIYRSQTRNGNVNTNAFMPLPLERTLRESYGDNFKYLVMSS